MMGETGTVYGLADPRDGKVRYVGQTKQRVSVRIRGTYAPRVRAWMAELLDAGLTPLAVALRENVPADQLRDAESEEITRIIVAGGTLLNEQVTALGRKMLDERREAERERALRAAWAEVADAGMAILGGPLAPGELPVVEIPDAPWRFISTEGPARMAHADSLFRSADWRAVPSEHYALHRAAKLEWADAGDRLWGRMQGAWGDVRHVGGDSFNRCIERNTRAVLNARCARREDASRFLSLAVWYAVAVQPWRHLAEMAGLALDDGSFIAWAGRDDEVRKALAFLAGCGDGMMERLSIGEHCPQLEKSPGHLLAAVAAAYSGAEPPEVIRFDLAVTLGELADDHMLTQPMADLLVRLNPRALDSVFGEDISAELDRELGLPAGTSGRVLLAFGGRVGHINDGTVRRAIDRCAQALPVVALPDYGDWSGPGVPAARAIAGSLVRAGLAEPERMSAEEYLAEVRALWTPRPDDRRRMEAA